MRHWEAMRRMCWVVLACLPFLASACSDDSGGEGATQATVPKATTTTAIDVSKVPDEITVAYADAVMDELDKVLGEAIRILVREKAPTKEFDQRLDALYDEPELEHQRSAWGHEAAREMEGYRESPGDPVTQVLEILRSKPGCVLLGVRRDFGPMFVAPKGTDDTSFVALSLKRDDSDPARLNPTAWTMVFDADTRSGELPRECS